MPLNYSIVLLGNPRKPDDPKKAYARSQVSKELTLKGLSQRVAAQTTVSRADVSAVLISVVENMIEALRDGEQVDFGELGKFRLQAPAGEPIARRCLLPPISPESISSSFPATI